MGTRVAASTDPTMERKNKQSEQKSKTEILADATKRDFGNPVLILFCFVGYSSTASIVDMSLVEGHGNTSAMSPGDVGKSLMYYKVREADGRQTGADS